jgi:hypothetical protein
MEAREGEMENDSELCGERENSFGCVGVDGEVSWRLNGS